MKRKYCPKSSAAVLLGIVLLFFFAGCEKDKWNTIPDNAKTLEEMHEEVRDVLITPKPGYIWITNAVPKEQDFRAYTFEFMKNNRVRTTLLMYNQIPLIEDLRGAEKRYVNPEIQYRNTELGIRKFFQDSYYSDPGYASIRSMFRTVAYGFGAISDADLITTIVKKGREVEFSLIVGLLTANFDLMQFLGLKSRIIPLFEVMNEIPYKVSGPISTNLAFTTQSFLSDAKEFKTFDFDFNVLSYSRDSMVLKAANTPLPNKEVIIKPISKVEIDEFGLASYLFNYARTYNLKVGIKVNGKEPDIYLIEDGSMLAKEKGLEYFMTSFKQTLNYNMPCFGFRHQRELVGYLATKIYHDVPELEEVGFLKVSQVKDPYPEILPEIGETFITLTAYKKGAKSEADKLPIIIEFTRVE